MIGSVSMQSGGAWGGQIDLSAMRQQRAAKMFQSMDADGSGSISKDEFASWDKKVRERMPQMGGAGSMPSAEDIFTALDSDGDSSLSQTELSSMGEKMRALGEAQMFKEADADGSGTVSKDEFASWQDKVQAQRAQITGMGQGPSTDDVFGRADSDGNGGLSAAEFSALGKMGGPQGGPPPGPPPGGGAPGGAAGGSAIGSLLDALNSEDDESSSTSGTQLDANGDGKISLQELVAWIKNYSSSQGQGGQDSSGSSLDLVA